LSILRRLLVALTLCLALSAASANSSDDTLLIRNARVFDGTGAPARRQSVLVRDGIIVEVAERIARPRGARLVDASGLTLLPGLHDLHTHLRSPAYSAPDDLGKSYAGYLARGVTRVNDFSVSGEMLAPIRAMTMPSGPVEAPRLELAIRLGVPGGHGTEYGWGNFFTMQAATPRAAHVAMATALPYRPDVIKVFADGWRYGRSPDLNSMNEPTLRAIVQDAHAAGIPVITHTVTLEGAKVAAAAGVDAVGHGIGDAPADDALIRLMRANGTAYIPTLVVYEPQQDRRFVPAEWQALSPPERAREEAQAAESAEPIPEQEARRWQIMRDNVRAMKAAGIPVGIGTDAGIGGVYHGPSTIREIWWLTQLGYTPADALVSATRTSAAILRKADGHGTIAPGQAADIILTGGQPDLNILDLWNVRRVFVAGREVPLAKVRALLASSEPTPLPITRMTGPIDTGTGPSGRTDLDTLPVESTEAGIDHSHLDVVRPGQDAERPLFLVARMGAAQRPYAQLILPLTRGAVTPADASGFTGVAVQVRGQGRYLLRFDSYALPQSAWFEADLSAGATTREVRIPFSSFRSKDPHASLDLTRLRALIVRLNGSAGNTEWLELGQVRFYQ